MSLLADRLPVATSTTNRPEPPPELPAVEAAQQFYLYGSSGAVWAQFKWVPAGRVYYFPPETRRIEPLLDWVRQELSRLMTLQPGWDGHRAKPITEHALYGTGWVLSALLNQDSVAPQFFPLPDGGIQIEWFADDEIEIEIDGSGQGHVLAAAANGDTIAEGTFDPQAPGELIADVAKFLEELSARVKAER